MTVERWSCFNMTVERREFFIFEKKMKKSKRVIMNSKSNSLKNFVVDGSERSVQDIVSKLKFISKIREGEIVDVSNLSLSERNWKTSMYRTLFARKESRHMTLDFFRQVVGEAFDLATLYLRSEEQFFQNIGSMIISALQESKAGILNHAKTYSHDRMHVSKTETLLRTLDTKISDLHSQQKI